MNGISPLNYREVTPEKERRALLFMDAACAILMVALFLLLKHSVVFVLGAALFVWHFIKDIRGGCGTAANPRQHQEHSD